MRNASQNTPIGAGRSPTYCFICERVCRVQEPILREFVMFFRHALVLQEMRKSTATSRWPPPQTIKPTDSQQFSQIEYSLAVSTQARMSRGTNGVTRPAVFL